MANDAAPAVGSAVTPAWRVAVIMLLLVLPVAYAPLRGILAPSAPAVSSDWPGLVDEVRAFERGIGFEATRNFVEFSAEHHSYAFCGYASRLTLPYSYEDPAIQWADVETVEECSKSSAGADTYFGSVEALGESGTPVTPAMARSRLDRFLYLVIHEDCHDQFDLPYGIEEALCNVLAYKAMVAFTDGKFAWYASEERAVRRYAALESRRNRATKDFYEELEMVYARHALREVPEDRLLAERSRILARARLAMGWKGGPLNNVILASHMTYSRHYPFLESVLEAHGRDLSRTVAFFKHIDWIKPSADAIIEQQGIESGSSVEFLRAYEAAVVETIRKALAAGR